MPVTVRGLAYFDRKVFKTNWKNINESPLKKAGLMVRKVAVRSVRKRKMKVRGKPPKGSPPGTPPRSRAPGHPYRRIFSIPNSWATSVIVGPVGFNSGTPPTPEVHEFGLTARRRVMVEDRTRRRAKGRGRKKRYILIDATVNYPKRATMRPALQKVKSKLPALWRNSIRG